jgi:DNA-binding CsgD family transcriptional regulator
MLGSQFMTVASATCRDEFQSAVVRFARWLGFDFVSAMTVVDSLEGEPKFAWVDNTPEPFRATFEDFAAARRDPVMQHCKRASTPIVWTQRDYTDKGVGDLWDAQACFGYRTGLAVAHHLPGGRHIMVGVDRDQSLPANEAELARLVADLNLFVTCAGDSALRVLAADAEPNVLRPPTARELEALRWTMEGKTAWEVGRILAISEQTAVKHLSNATRKLGCVNKHQAVLRALRMGLIR